MTGRNHRRALIGATAWVALASFGSAANAAQAQDPAPAPASDQASVPSAAQPDASPLGAGQDIVVTAQKRSEKAQNVGIAITAFSGAQLQQLGVVQTADLSRVTPGVSLTGSDGGQNLSFVIRGVQQQDFAAIAEGPNAVYVDDGYVGLVNVAGIGLFDIDSVAILKGPQGTLFGRNATGGVVSITTRAPGNRPNGYLDLTYGSHDTVRAEGAIGGPLSDTVSARVSGFYDTNGNYIKNTAPHGGDLGGVENWGVRGKLNFHPDARLSVELTGFATGAHMSWAPYFRQNVIPVFGPGGAVIDALPTDASTGFGPGSDAKHLIVAADEAQSTGGFQFMQGGNLKVSYDDGNGLTLTAISDYKHDRSRILLDDSVTPFFVFKNIDDDFFDSFSQELRAYKAWSDVRWTTGLYYLYMRNRFISNQDWRGAGTNDVISNSHLITSAYAAFSQVEWDFAPRWTVIAGGRYTRDEKRFTYLATDPFAGGATVRRFPASGGEAHLNGNLFTGKLAVQYKPSRNALLYLSYNRGAKAGSFNAPIHANNPPADPFIPYKPEYLDAYEAGFKLDTWQGKARFNGSVFYYDYRDQQVQLFVLPLNSYIVNLANRTYGVESEIRLNPVQGLSLAASGSYINALAKHVALNGNPPANYRPAVTPRVHLTFLARYEFPLLNGSFALQGDAQYQSSSFIGLTNYTAERIPAYWVAGARVSWTDASRKWSAALSADNVFDKRYRTVGFDAALFGFEQYGVGRPRWYRFTVGYHF